MNDKSATYLTPTSVSVLTITDGINHRTAYENSESGRQLLIDSEPDYIVEEVMQVWGEEPTVEEPEYDFNQDDTTDTNIDVWDEIAEAIKTGVNEL